MGRSYSKGWRQVKPNVCLSLNPINWSIAFQTAVLIILSACMLGYLLLTPSDSGGLPEEESTVGISAAKPVHNPYGSTTFSSYSHSSAEPLGPVEKEVSRGLDKESNLVSLTNATTSVNHSTTLIAVAKKSRREKEKIQLRIIAEDLEMYSDPTARYYPLPTVCRVFNGCAEADGTIILRESMRTSRAKLRACGITKVKFESLLSGAGSGDDLFTNVLRYHMPHLATDVLSLTYAMSVVRGEYPHQDRVSPRTKSIRPVVVGQDRIRSMSPGAWTLKMLAKLPYQTQVKTKNELFVSQSPPSAVQRTCFRSIVSFEPQIYWQVNPSRFLHENSLFSQNQLWTRSPRRRGPPGSLCAPVVTVLNRPPGDQRTLSNVDEIESNFDRLRRSQEFAEVAGASFRIEYMNSSFHDQMRIIQDADVILASHGAALANLLFSRVDTPVLEVFPFSASALSRQRARFTSMCFVFSQWVLVSMLAPRSAHVLHSHTLTI